MVTPEQLTGAYVKQVRTKHKLSRERLQEMCGIGGKSTARLANIENKDSWKADDRDVVARVLNALESDQPLPVESPAQHASRIDAYNDGTAEYYAPAGDVQAWTDDDFAQWEEETAAYIESSSATSASSVAPDPGDVIVSSDDDDDDTFTVIEPAYDGDESGEPTTEDSVEPFVITHSQMRSFKRCKRKWWLEWYRNLKLREQDMLDERSTGNRVHRALQAWYVPDGQTPVDPRDALEHALMEDWTAIANTTREKGHDEFVLADLGNRFNKAAELERAMIEGYMEWVAETGNDAELKIVASEQVVQAHLFDHVRYDGQVIPVSTAGILDTRARRTSDNARVFIDHKTVGDLKQPVKLLPQNEQMLHYMLLEWLTSTDADERCDTALYNMLRRVKRTARANPPFYDRFEVHHNEYELDSYKRRLIATSRNILQVREQLDAGVNPLNIVEPTPTQTCSWDCDFFAICSMFDDGSRVEDALSALYVEHDPHDRYSY